MSNLPLRPSGFLGGQSRPPGTVEERKMLNSLETLIHTLNKLKDRLLELLQRFANEGVNADWPRYLNSFALCASELAEVRKVLQSDHTLPLGNVCALPVLLSRTEDYNLMQQTERRLVCFSHEHAPHYLRTKLAPEVEARRNEQLARAAVLAQSTLITPETVSKAQLPARVLDQLLQEIAKVKLSLDGEWPTAATSGAGAGAMMSAVSISPPQAADASRKMLQFMMGNIGNVGSTSKSAK